MKSKVIKRCSDCGRFLSEDDFHWANKEKKNWRKSCCKRCDRNRRRLGYQDTREREMIRMKEWYKEHKQHNIEYRKQYKQNNKNIVNRLNAKRRAMRLNQILELTEIEQNRIKFIYDTAFTMSDYHVDHIQPISKGGLHHPDNMQILHKDLNLEKHNKYPLTKGEKIRYKGFRL